MLDSIRAAAAQVEGVVVGKSRQVRLALACLVARGHLLVEDLPGVGKTTLAHALALTLGLDFRRVQFTSDLLPADITGGSVWERDTGRFVFRPGPVFAQVLLGDEINRASPRTQSALLEAMEERQVSADGVAHALPSPFFVIATQNPQDQVGTWPLPESQLDRFLMCLDLGYPDARAERELLAGQDRRAMLAALRPVMTPETLLAAQAAARRVRASGALLDYVQALLAHSRRAPAFAEGLSPRAGLGLMDAARAWALLDGREHLLPDDVQAVLPAVAGHRLRPARGATATPGSRAERVATLLREVPVP